VRAALPVAPEPLWEIISDVTRHPELAGSGEVVQTELLTPGLLVQGSRFQSRQNMRGMRYRTISHVVACEPPRRLAWQIGLPGTPPFGQVWQFELTPQAGGGTLVEHGVALPYALLQAWPVTLLTDQGMQNEAATMVPTLRNLARLAGVEAPASIETTLRPPPTAAALLPSPIYQGLLWASGGLLLLSRTLRRSEEA
jgi:uncharacterized protein YndB with AHSA1/START domain